MDLVALRRQHTKWAIQQNPTTITIRRTEKIDVGGHFEEVKSEVGPFVVRIYQYGTWAPRQVNTLAGTKQVDRTWGMLMDYEADVKAGSNVLDEFEVPDLGRFQVLEVYPQKVKDKIVGYQVTLVKVS